MSLLECICCALHGQRTAVAWEDASTGNSGRRRRRWRATCYHTYSDLFGRARTLADALSDGRAADSPAVGIYGRSCPSILVAFLAVLMMAPRPPSGESPVRRGVACMPLAAEQRPAEQERSLQRCGVRLILVEESVIDVCMCVWLSNYDNFN